MLRSKNNAERESIMNQRPVQKEEEKELSTLNDFMKKYPDNITTPLVYFDNGMSPVQSPFVSMMDKAPLINMNDQYLSSLSIGEEIDENTLYKLVNTRIDSIYAQFNARVMFLSRSLALNLDQSITNILHDTFAIVLDREKEVKFVANSISYMFFKAIRNECFSNSEDDYIASYSFNTSIIPRITASAYDCYDDAIVKAICNTDEITSDAIHLKILKDIAPVFESFKAQLEWLSYMLRSEAVTIYRPMAMQRLFNDLETQHKHHSNDTDLTDDEIDREAFNAMNNAGYNTNGIVRF